MFDADRTPINRRIFRPESSSRSTDLRGKATLAEHSLGTIGFPMYKSGVLGFNDQEVKTLELRLDGAKEDSDTFVKDVWKAVISLSLGGDWDLSVTIPSEVLSEIAAKIDLGRAPLIEMGVETDLWVEEGVDEFNEEGFVWYIGPSKTSENGEGEGVVMSFSWSL